MLLLLLLPATCLSGCGVDDDAISLDGYEDLSMSPICQADHPLSLPRTGEQDGRKFLGHGTGWFRLSNS